jgi:hypothetical protein
VPNEKLMSSELLNITQSRPFQERLFFEVDARLVSQAILDDLSDRLHALTVSEDDCSLFDQTFDCFAHIAAVTDPLKYQVRSGACAASVHAWVAPRAQCDPADRLAT